MITILSAILVLGVLIFVHELGHFLVAKRCGVGVTVFSLGFGPALFSFTRGETNYRLSAIPLGGYVRMVGEDPTEEVEPEVRERSFTHKSPGRRLAIVAAGPVFNVLFAIVVYFMLAAVIGVPQLGTVVGGVRENQPAALAGLQKDDLILAINGQPVRLWSEMVDEVRQSGGAPLTFLVERDGREMEFSMSPIVEDDKNVFGEDIRVYRVGIEASAKGLYTEDVSLAGAIKVSLQKTWEAGTLIFTSVVKLVSGSIPLDSMGGPVKIAQIAGEAASYGLAALASLAALLSVNLAILNLLPIPALDGGHLLFFGVEAITKRKPSMRFMARAQQIGVLLLVTLMVVVLYNDIAGLIRGN